ncbi:MAG: helix-turn-helix domain-containing protein [Methylococcales bacterium]
MKIETTPSEIEIPDTLNAPSDDIPLGNCVKAAVELYFENLNGHPPDGLYGMLIAEVEAPLFRTVLEHTGYNQTKAAKILGVSRSTLRKKMDQYEIE